MNESSEYDYECNGVILGDTGVGKTNLLLSFATYSNVDAVRSPTGVAYTLPTSQGKNVKLKIRDGATISNVGLYNGVILAYDITNKESFKYIQQWFEKVELHNILKLPQYILVGCKSDLAETARQVETAEAAAYAEKLGIPFVETSIKTNTNIEKVFMVLAEKMELTNRLNTIREQLVNAIDAPSPRQQEVTAIYRAYEKELKAIPNAVAKARALRRLDSRLFFALKNDIMEKSLLIPFAKQNIQRWREEAMTLIKQIVRPSPGGVASIFIADLEQNLTLLKEKLPGTETSLHKELVDILAAIASTRDPRQQQHASSLPTAAPSASSAPLDRKMYHPPSPSFTNHSAVFAGPGPGPSSSMTDTKQTAPPRWIDTYREIDALLENLVMDRTDETRKKLASLRDRLLLMKDETVISSAKAMMSFQLNKINRALGGYNHLSSSLSNALRSATSSSSSPALSASSPSSTSSSVSSSSSSSAVSSSASNASSVSASSSSFFPSTGSVSVAAPTTKPEAKLASEEDPFICPISLDMMEDPVIPLLLDKNGKVTQAGDSFDRAALLEWCKDKNPPLCPLTKQRIYLQDGQPILINNKALKDAIAVYKLRLQQEEAPASTTLSQS